MDIGKLKKLREETNIGISTCREALEESGGDIEEAKKILRKRGQRVSDAMSSRNASQGLITSYVHHNMRVAAMVEIHCETDFAATLLVDFANEICMQIAAFNPEFLSSEDVPLDRLSAEEDVFLETAKQAGKPENIIPKIVAGKIKKFYIEHCLMDQKTVKDASLTIRDVVNDKMQQIGEKIEIVRFERFQLH